MHTHTRLAWARLNSDGALVGSFLATLALVRLLFPETDDVTRELGVDTPVFYFRHGLLLIGGLLMTFSFVVHKVGAEMTGRFLVAFALCLTVVRAQGVLGWAHPETLTDLMLATFVVLFFGFRASVLLSKKVTAIAVGGNQ